MYLRGWDLDFEARSLLPSYHFYLLW